jgi:serine/threonine-protein kinase
VTEERPTSSTAITFVHLPRPNPRRVLSTQRLSREAGAREGEFEPNEVIPGTRYRVLRLLGVGGMGSVYEVEHTELGKRFVLKALQSELALREDLVARLRNEQRALGRLEHPNIVTVTDAGVTREAIPYFVMERLEGETLAARLKRLARLPILEALGIAAGVLDGLAAAHEIGVVHRDIKPQNILLVAGRRPKILDFGVAKVMAGGSAITARGVAVGTPRYMSPEQACGERVDGRCDLYAVGLVLFEAMVGRGPFDDVRDANELLLAHVSRQPPSLSSLVPSVTRELDAAVLGLLEKVPAARPPTARVAAASLRAVARRYSPHELEAPTPHAGYASTTRLFGLQLANCAPTTRIEPLAARPESRRETATEDVKTLVRDAAPARDTWIDERSDLFARDAGELSSGGDGARYPTPVFTRTEVLEHLPGARQRGDEETRTRVSLAATSGPRTLDPVPAVSRSAPGRPSRRQALAVGLAALIVGATSTVAVGRGFSRREPLAVREPLAARSSRSSAVELTAAGLAKPVPARAPEPVLEKPAFSGAAVPVQSVSARKPAKKPRRDSGLPSSGL